MTLEDSYKKIWDKNQTMIAIAKGVNDAQHRDYLAMYNKITSFLTYGADKVFNQDQLAEFRSEMWSAFAQRILNFNPNISLDELRKYVNVKLPKKLGIWDCVIVIASYFRSVDEMKVYAEGFVDSLNELGSIEAVPETLSFSVSLANRRKDEALKELEKVDATPKKVTSVVNEVESVESLMNFDNFFERNMNLPQYYQNNKEG